MTVARELSSAEPRLWRTGLREIVIDRPIIAGILNVTPDSFSDGGNFFSPAKAVEHARRMVSEGADMIDVGGESTRPGATIVPEDEEIRRIVPAIRAVRTEFPGVVISVDTTKASVAAEAIDAGADVVNDVSAMRLDSGMADVVRESGAGLVLMHSRGGVEDMASYARAKYDSDPVSEIVAEIRTRVQLAVVQGIERERIVLDPGFGFSKVSKHSRALLAELGRIVRLGFPVMVGVSRKRFVTEAMLSRSFGGDVVQAGAVSLVERDAGTVAFNVVALMRGARIFRVHNVLMNRRALDAAWSLLEAAPS